PVKLVCLGLAPVEDNIKGLSERVAGSSGRLRPEPDPDGGRRLGRHRQRVPERALGPRLPGVHGRGTADDMVVDAVLRVQRVRLAVEEPRVVGLVLAEQRPGGGSVRRVAREQLKRAEERVLDVDAARGIVGGAGAVGGDLQRRLRGPVPGPRVAEPGGRQHVDRLSLVAGVRHLDLEQQLGRVVALGVRDVGDPVAVLVEDTGVEDLVLRTAPVPARALRAQLLVRKRGVRVVVAPRVPGVARHGVGVPPVLLDVLAVVALRPGQPEQPLLEKGIPAVPQRETDAEVLVDVAEPGQAVLAPPVSAGPGVIERQVVPRVAVLAVVLADRAPLPLADVGPPCVPRAGLLQPVLKLAESGYPVALNGHAFPRLSSVRLSPGRQYPIAAFVYPIRMGRRKRWRVKVNIWYAETDGLFRRKERWWIFLHTRVCKTIHHHPERTRQGRRNPVRS